VFTPKEVARLRSDCYQVLSPARRHPDGNITEKDGDSVRVSFGVDLESEAVSAATRIPRILGPVRRILGDRVYLFQTRINAKMGRVGDRYPWHTDYANWVNDGIRRGGLHDMITVGIMLTSQTPSNGALQVVPGSHRRGVGDLFFDPVSVGYQSYNAPEAYVREVLAETPPVMVTGEPGDVALFAPEIMHGSEPNPTPDDRLYLMFIYNRSDNLPVDAPTNRRHMTPYVNYRYAGDLTLVDDGAVLATRD
jgi:ectoine hydroxylase